MKIELTDQQEQAVRQGRAVEVVWGQERSLAALGSALLAPRAGLRALLADTQCRRLAALVALSVLATMVNPHGPALLYYSYSLSKNPNIPHS